jgi:3-methyladenine DNA glycosylase AlkD
LRAALADAGNPEEAGAMARYMKEIQPFYGVKSKQAEQIFRAALHANPIATQAEYTSAIEALWHGPFREEKYQALRLAGRKPFFHIDNWDIYEALVRSADWWDTLDWLAGRIVSPLLLQHRELETQLRLWRDDPHLWTRRASLLAHLKHKSATNRDLLAETILHLAHEEEFFIRKAIGWVLRDYSYAAPDWVEAFVAEHTEHLSPLSRREALKAIARRRSE